LKLFKRQNESENPKIRLFGICQRRLGGGAFFFMLELAGAYQIRGDQRPRKARDTHADYDCAVHKEFLRHDEDDFIGMLVEGPIRFAGEEYCVKNFKRTFEVYRYQEGKYCDKRKRCDCGVEIYFVPARRDETEPRPTTEEDRD